MLTLRYTASCGDAAYTATHTVLKLTDGADAYIVHIESENGTTFRSGPVSTVLRARVYKGDEEITGQIPDSSFRWYRSGADQGRDEQWNAAQHQGREIAITGEDISDRTVFDCEVEITKDI